MYLNRGKHHYSSNGFIGQGVSRMLDSGIYQTYRLDFVCKDLRIARAPLHTVDMTSGKIHCG